MLDIGCGEGKDAVFFAKNGYRVSAFDVAPAGLGKAQTLAHAQQVQINFFQANLFDFRLDTEFDIIFSSGVLHYLGPGSRKEIIQNYKQHTAPRGIHACNVFVQKPFIPPAPDEESPSTLWHSGEIATYYHDWYFHTYQETIFTCHSSNIPHQHCMDILIAENNS